MSEYRYVEKPFLDQLDALGWTIIDQGESSIPSDPSKSLRSSFREIVLKNELFKALREINLTDESQPWLTEKQLEEIYDTLVTQSGDLIEANQNIQELLYKYIVDKNELTEEINPSVSLVNFKSPEKNSFIAINQFRIDTPGKVKGMIIPDIVLFVNGLPLVVIEAKDGGPYTSNPMAEAIVQLWRYSNQRVETKEAGLEEGEEKLFHFNQFMIATHGKEAKYGTITSSSDQYFYSWKSIYPEKYQDFNAPLGKIREQETLIQGMLAKETLIDIIHSFILFMQDGEHTIKVAPRYQQYRAVHKMKTRLEAGINPDERSGVIWHTQGSGKSLTMVFLIRKMRHTQSLKDYKIIVINDRNDLEEQLEETMTLTAEKVIRIENGKDLKRELKDDRSNLNMVMVHKFQERDIKAPQYIKNALKSFVVPRFKVFDVVNESDRVLILVDEAHRTQSSDLGNNLFEAFPNATKIAFTGTPLITDRHKQKTMSRFGGRYIDTYKLKDAVEDGNTVQILYEGKTADTAIYSKHEFDRKFDDLFKERSPEELAAIKKKYGALGEIMETEERIKEICDDIVEHYATKILPNNFKAQIVCHSRDAAVTYDKCLRNSLSKYIAILEVNPERDKDLLEMLKFLTIAVVISGDGTNERAAITMARKHAKEINAIDNFKKRFDFEKPETGLAFLIVCDMLLTGFDAKIEQVMYLDKKIKEHNLLQAIARVNRVYPGKTVGYIVDYVGIADNLTEALSIYSTEDQQEILDSFKGVEAELPILEDRYKRLLMHFTDAGIKQIQDFVEQKIEDTNAEYDLLEKIIMCLKDIERREAFDVYFKKFLISLDIIVPNPLAKPFIVPAKRFGYIHAKVKQHYQDDSISIAGVGEKVRKLINEHLISLGINPKIPVIALISDSFIKEVEKSSSPKSRASEMEHAIRKHCKVHLEEDPAYFQSLSDKLDAALEKHKDHWDQLCIELYQLRSQAITGRTTTIEGLDTNEMAFYDLIVQIAYDKSELNKQQSKKLVEFVHKAIEELSDFIDIINFWENPAEVKNLRGKLTDLIYLSEDNQLIESKDKVISEVMALIRKKDNQLLGRSSKN